MSGKPLALASALQKIEYYAQHRIMTEATPSTAHMFIINPLHGRGDWMTSLFSTHPTTGDRVARLQALADKHR
jgi:heat shock protein HtpX